MARFYLPPLPLKQIPHLTLILSLTLNLSLGFDPDPTCRKDPGLHCAAPHRGLRVKVHHTPKQDGLGVGPVSLLARWPWGRTSVITSKMALG